MLRRDRPTRRSKVDKLESKTTSPLPNLGAEQDDAGPTHQLALLGRSLWFCVSFQLTLENSQP
jgi:hypothetical protein